MTEQTDETTEEETPKGGVNADPEGGEETEEEPETFPREYVEKLRKEAAEHRTRAQRAEDLGQRLHASLVSATGRLVSADELPYDESHLDDEDALNASIDALLKAKPYLASRKVNGDVGQGASKSSESVDLAGMLRARA